MPVDWIQGVVFIGLLICLTPLIGTYMAKVLMGEPTFATSTLGKLENICYAMGGTDPSTEMTWKEYGKALFIFNFLGIIALFLLQRMQGYLPLNPQGFEAVPWPLAWNIAISFVTNTNWQSYSGETTLSYLTQMVGLTSQNFLSAATGMGGLLVLTRGLVGKEAKTVGNFWVDLVRMVVYLLLPLSILLATFLVGQGVVQTFSPYQEVTTLENGKQIIPLGPVASQIAIKQIGTNGGGFFNANGSHPFENPTDLSNFFEMLAILLIPAATVYTYGIMIGSKRHGWVLFIVMLTFWTAGTVLAYAAESTFNASIGVYPIFEGIETRFGIFSSLLWSVSTTAVSNGSINSMLSSLSPLTGGVAMFNIMLGELIFGVGVGLSSMIMMVLLTVFLSGLMVGRTPEYLGKKIEKQEMQWVVLAVLMPGAMTLLGAGISSVIPEAVSSISNKGPHGLSEIVYAFASCSGNNGSAFAGLNANTPYFNIVLGFVMLIGRIFFILPSLAIAGLLSQKRIAPHTIGTFSTSSVLFTILLMSVIFIFGALTFFPGLTLGPIVEHLLMLEGKTF